ncbi:chemotaxis protein methyltransferase CheR [Rhodoblastus acidophilus]|uniref:CheR family methyltransferase n=1 Tax=Rhodoblastus acidophilus TaxID=1074 RepID=UPI002224C2CC|nr:protein-glutamate O-methyltransferase [Rhodoblastus acidophilus]MCW2283280.1 chemotaxis protein methyltransferase CheR [Rhodoblastus acidophilus]MCW2332140.1 chemotaxis protein methyltransferase CheR [Rhodoblastus acidophilus]
MSALRQDSLFDGDYPLTREDFRDIAAMLYADARIHLTDSKASLVYSRLIKRLRALNLESFADYCALLREDEDERAEMLSALTTNVTRFFRERHHFEHLSSRVLPNLLAQARRGGRVRLWSAGCSSGEEPYSIALTILEQDPRAADLDVKVLATDIDPRMVARGRDGIYAEAALAEDIAAPALQRFFLREGAQRRAGDELRKMVAFRRLNLNGDWPMRGPFDVIFCRNVAIYFDDATQGALWEKFADKLSPGGWLYIGHSERVDGPASARLSSAGVTAYRRNAEPSGDAP